MAERKIKMQKGYPTTDGQIHDKYSDAVKCQSDIDFTKACGDKFPDIELALMREFMIANKDVVLEYIKQHLTVKPVAKKPTEEKTAKPAKDKNKDKT